MSNIKAKFKGLFHRKTREEKRQQELLRQQELIRKKKRLGLFGKKFPKKFVQFNIIITLVYVFLSGISSNATEVGMFWTLVALTTLVSPPLYFFCSNLFRSEVIVYKRFVDDAFSPPKNPRRG